MRVRLVLSSVGLHALALLVLVSLPRAPAPSPASPAPELAEVELIAWTEPGAQLLGGPDAKSTAEPPDEDPEPADAKPDAASPPQDNRESPPPNPRATEPSVEPAMPAPEPVATRPGATPDDGGPAEANGVYLPPDTNGTAPTPDTADTPAAAGALSLSGLRGNRRGTDAPAITRGAIAGAGLDVRPRGRKPVVPYDGVIRTPAQAGFERKRDGRLVFRDPDPGANWSAELMPDGRVRFKDYLGPKVQGTSVKMPGLYEVYAAASNMGMWTRRKQRLLAATRDMRRTMAITFAKKNIDRQLAALRADLLAIWNSERPPRTRRRLLFETWDDCEEQLVVKLGEFEDDGAAVDAVRRGAGTKARAQILAFIRRHLPADSADAYPTAELSALNKTRASRARFDPYVVL